MKIYFIIIRTSVLLLPFLVLFNSCKLHDKFPVSINDIDTLSIYRKYQDSLANHSGAKDDSLVVTIQPQLKNDSLELASVKWTICTGVFEIKQNARRRFMELNKKNKAYLIIKDHKYYITTGVFTNKNSALDYRKNNNQEETFILEIKSGEQLSEQFPD